VFLAYHTPQGHAFLDRALYLPESWTSDPERRQAADIPAPVPFTTKPTLARQMIERALERGIPARWVTGDTIYGSDLRIAALARSAARQLCSGLY
jgi:SRSO17 transposase